MTKKPPSDHQTRRRTLIPPPTRAEIIDAQFQGYRYYPRSRPPCDMCGPFASAFMRTLVTGETRCRGCDEEDP